MEWPAVVAFVSFVIFVWEAGQVLTEWILDKIFGQKEDGGDQEENDQDKEEK